MIDRESVDQLAAQVREITAACTAEPVRAALLEVAERLDAPLRVAVAGRMKAGKSTVVNALLGRSIAPTAATECTRVVAQYEFADDEVVWVYPNHGTPYAIATTRSGGPPDDLGAPASEIDHIAVRMSSSRRRAWTLVDTPGLDSTTSGVSETTERAVLGDPASVRATSTVDALIYLMPHPGETDVAFLSDFGAVFDGTRLGAVNIVGVLSKVDLLDGAGRSDPIEEGRRLAHRKSEELAGVVDSVVPVSGLLAQTAVAGGYREHHTRAIRTLATVDPSRLGRSLRLLDRFLADDAVGLEASERRELAGILGVWGISRAVTAYSAGSTTTRAIVDHLRSLSNLDELTSAVDGRLTAGASLVRIATCVDQLESIAYRAGAAGETGPAERLQATVAEVRSRPDFHRIVEVQTLRRFDPERSRLDDELRQDVIAVLRGADAGARLGMPDGASAEELKHAAAARAMRWRGIENNARTRRSDQAVAAVLRRSYELTARRGGSA